MIKELFRIIVSTFEYKYQFILLLFCLSISAFLDVALVGMIIPLSVVVLDLETSSFPFLTNISIDATTLMIVFATLLFMKMFFQLGLHWYVYTHFFKYYRKTALGIVNSHFVRIERVADNEAGLATEITSELEELTKTVLIPGMFFFSELIFLTSLTITLCLVSFKVFFGFFCVIVILFAVLKFLGSKD